MKSNKSISRRIFGRIPFFCNFKNGQKSIFEWGKSLKLPKMQLHKNILSNMENIVVDPRNGNYINEKSILQLQDVLK